MQKGRAQQGSSLAQYSFFVKEEQLKLPEYLPRCNDIYSQDLTGFPVLFQSKFPHLFLFRVLTSPVPVALTGGGRVHHSPWPGAVTPQQ